MAQQIVNIGTLPNDGTGDPLRVAYSKINDNFTELYSGSATIPIASGSVLGGVKVGSGLSIDGTGVLSVDAGTTQSQVIPIAASDEITAITAGTNKVTFRMPYAFILSEVRASLTTAQASGSIFTVDINQGGTSILSTKITIDNTEKTSKTATTLPVISTSSLTDDAEITIDVDQVGNGTATGLKVYMIGVMG